MHMFRGRGALVVALLATGCGGTSTRPTPAAGTAVTQTVFNQIQGNVFDTAFRPLSGVRVEIVDGSGAGTFTISDANGQFSFSGGQYVDSIHFRASKDGYNTISVSGLSSTVRPNAVASLVITLDSTAAPAKIEPGAYSLTVISDSSCTGIPDSLRTRAYSATIAPSRDSPRTLYNVDVTGPSLAPFGFGIGVAGNDLAFTIDGPAFGEHLPPLTYLEISGAGATSLSVSPASTITFLFSGSFSYCELRSEMESNRNCYTTPSDQKVAGSQCLSSNHHMMLTQR
jgi:hypothetical protein